MQEQFVEVPQSAVEDGPWADPAQWAARRLRFVQLDPQRPLHAGDAGGCTHAASVRRTGTEVEVVVPDDALESGWDVAVCCANLDDQRALTALRRARSISKRVRSLTKFADVLRAGSAASLEELCELIGRAQGICRATPGPYGAAGPSPEEQLIEWAQALLQVAPVALASSDWLRGALVNEIAVVRTLQRVVAWDGGADGTEWVREGLAALYSNDFDPESADTQRVLSRAAGVFLEALGGGVEAVSDDPRISVLLQAWKETLAEVQSQYCAVVFDPRPATAVFDEFGLLCSWAFSWVGKISSESSLALAAGRFGLALVPRSISRELFEPARRASARLLPGEASAEFLGALREELLKAASTESLYPSLENLKDPLFEDPLLARVSRARVRLGGAPTSAGWVRAGQQVTWTVRVTGTVEDPDAWTRLVTGAGSRRMRERMEAARASGGDWLAEYVDQDEQAGRELAALYLLERTLGVPGLAGMGQVQASVEVVRLDARAEDV